MKLKNGVSDRIKEKLSLLKSRVGYRRFTSDPLLPSKMKEEDRLIVWHFADSLDKKIKEVEPLIRSLRSYIKFIGDPDKFVAAYLLIGKSFTSLKAVAALVRQGYSFQIVEIVRSSMESLHLAALFLEGGQEKLLERWFGGEIIGNRKAREALDQAINKMNKAIGGGSLPIQDALSDIYSIYSSYTHSGFAALFDFIDVFKEDFDFEQYSQFHYNRKYLHLIDNLYVNILLGLKNCYVRAKDKESLRKVEALLSQEGGLFASKDEIDYELQRYRRQS